MTGQLGLFFDQSSGEITTERLVNMLHDGGMDGLMVAADLVLTAAKRNIPIGDPAEDPDPMVALVESGGVEEHENGVIVYFDTIYAAKIHEDLRLKHPRGGTARYLEHALTEVVPSLEGIIASRLEARMASGLRTDPSRPHR
jgi:hypothetical protein